VTDDDNTLDGPLIELYEESAHLVQHPALRFLGEGEDRDDDEEEVTEEGLVAERRLRGAVMVAAIRMIDRCIEDMAEWQDPERIEEDPDEVLDATFVCEFFPPGSGPPTTAGSTPMCWSRRSRWPMTWRIRLLTGRRASPRRSS
jgi:hypothetical protein